MTQQQPPSGRECIEILEAGEEFCLSPLMDEDNDQQQTQVLLPRYLTDFLSKEVRKAKRDYGIAQGYSNTEIREALKILRLTTLRFIMRVKEYLIESGVNSNQKNLAIQIMWEYEGIFIKHLPNL